MYRAPGCVFCEASGLTLYLGTHTKLPASNERFITMCCTPLKRVNQRMSDCCKVERGARSTVAKRDCPVCQQRAQGVTVKTMLHHVKRVWAVKFTETQYYYCREPVCEVVYFATEAETITKSDIRTRIGRKEESAEALICFCFGVSKAEAAVNKDAKEFVIQQTRAARCSCETANPSGRCCLKDFPKQI